MAETPRRRRGAPDAANRWKPGERELRSREVTRQSYATVAQIIIAAVAILGVFVAGLAALKAGDAVDVAKRGIQSNADESRLSTAIGAIGGNEPTQRVAGLTLLRRLVTQRLENAGEDGASDSERSDARRLYNATVDIIATFLKTETASLAGSDVNSPQPVDVVYAEADLKRWLENKNSYRRLVDGGSQFTTTTGIPEPPSIDLAHATLFGVPWEKIDFSWLGSRYLPGVDLRQAKLTNSKWGSSTLSSAQLQCAHAESSDFKGSHFEQADLRDAHFQGADLSKTLFGGADLARADFTNARLQGADLTGADLTGADLTSAKLRGATLTNARLNDAELSNADLVDAKLAGADLTGARVDNSRASQDYGTKAHPECPSPDE